MTVQIRQKYCFFDFPHPDSWRHFSTSILVRVQISEYRYCISARWLKMYASRTPLRSRLKPVSAASIVSLLLLRGQVWLMRWLSIRNDSGNSKIVQWSMELFVRQIPHVCCEGTIVKTSNSTQSAASLLDHLDHNIFHSSNLAA